MTVYVRVKSASWCLAGRAANMGAQAKREGVEGSRSRESIAARSSVRRLRIVTECSKNVARSVRASSDIWMSGGGSGGARSCGRVNAGGGE